MNARSFSFLPAVAAAKTLVLAAGLALACAAGVAPAAKASEREVLAQINFARTQPARYADYLAGFARHYQGNLLVVPGETPIRTREGVSALNEAVQALRGARPLPPLAFSGGLSLAAADLTRDQARSGATGHQGGGGSPFARMSRHGRWEAHAGEAVDYGGATARRIVMNFLVDDGVRDRGHRLNLLAPDFTVAGVSCAPHPRFRRMCVIDFAGGFSEGGAALAGGPAGRGGFGRRPASPPMPGMGWQRQRVY